MVFGFKTRVGVLFVISAFMASVAIHAIDDSYVSGYVASANNVKIRYKGDTLKIYAAVPLAGVVAASICSVIGGGLFAGACYTDYNGLEKYFAGGIGGVTAVGSLAYLAYVIHEVNKTTPYITLNSSGVRTGTNAEIAWSRIAKVDVATTVSHTTQTTNIGGYGSIGTSTPVVTKFLQFFDKYDSPLLSIMDDGWLSLPFENLVCLAQWYFGAYGSVVR